MLILHTIKQRIGTSKIVSLSHLIALAVPNLNVVVFTYWTMTISLLTPQMGYSKIVFEEVIIY